MQKKEEMIQVRYYNVLIYLTFVEENQFKKEALIQRIDSGEQLTMREINQWCVKQQIPIEFRFVYRRDFPLKANLWNLYSYIRFMTTEAKIKTAEV
ncbi:MAG: hypothetical protein PHG16_07140 [Lachnospiraceae bacterium]|nr:hypothetical protein [Lachnospiraceae bacterium]